MDKENKSRLYDKYNGCEHCPYVEECVDESGYTCDDEHGHCPDDLLEKHLEEVTYEDKERFKEEKRREEAARIKEREEEIRKGEEKQKEIRARIGSDGMKLVCPRCETTLLITVKMIHII